MSRSSGFPHTFVYEENGLIDRLAQGASTAAHSFSMFGSLVSNLHGEILEKGYKGTASYISCR